MFKCDCTLGGCHVCIQLDNQFNMIIDDSGTGKSYTARRLVNLGTDNMRFVHLNYADIGGSTSLLQFHRNNQNALIFVDNSDILLPIWRDLIVGSAATYIFFCKSYPDALPVGTIVNQCVFKASELSIDIKRR